MPSMNCSTPGTCRNGISTTWLHKLCAAQWPSPPIVNSPCFVIRIGIFQVAPLCKTQKTITPTSRISRGGTTDRTSKSTRWAIWHDLGFIFQSRMYSSNNWRCSFSNDCKISHNCTSPPCVLQQENNLKLYKLLCAIPKFPEHKVYQAETCVQYYWY
jgi:hypothetical protein